MSSYIDHFMPRGRHKGVCVHSWECDVQERLQWLYGDSAARMGKNSSDVARWRKMGKSEAA